MADVRIAPDELRTLVTRIFAAAGAAPDIAAEVADHLVLSNLSGHDSHGVIRVPWYVEHIRTGVLDPKARPRLVSETEAAALVSGEWGFGHPAARVAIDLAVNRAKERGLGAAGLIRATHLGRLGTYTERAAGRGCVAMMWLGGLSTERASVPHGGARALYGTNPVSFAFPAGEDGPALLDYATTRIAGGKIMVAKDRGVPLEPGSLVDRDGNPSTDPDVFFEGGAILPFGEHKGYALAFFSQLLGQSLTGADQTGGERPGSGTFSRSGAFFLAVDPGLFRPAAEVREAAAAFVRAARAVPPAPGFDRVRAPGDPELEARRERARELTLPAATMEAIEATGRELGLSC